MGSRGRAPGCCVTRHPRRGTPLTAASTQEHSLGGCGPTRAHDEGEGLLDLEVERGGIFPRLLSWRPQVQALGRRISARQLSTRCSFGVTWGADIVEAPPHPESSKMYRWIILRLREVTLTKRSDDERDPRRCPIVVTTPRTKHIFFRELYKWGCPSACSTSCSGAPSLRECLSSAFPSPPRASTSCPKPQLRRPPLRWYCWCLPRAHCGGAPSEPDPTAGTLATAHLGYRSSGPPGPSDTT